MTKDRRQMITGGRQRQTDRQTHRQANRLRQLYEKEKNRDTNRRRNAKSATLTPVPVSMMVALCNQPNYPILTNTENRSESAQHHSSNTLRIKHNPAFSIRRQ